MAPNLDHEDPDASLLVRTDFTDDAAWDALIEEAGAAYGPDRFSASFVPVSDESFGGMDPAELAAAPGSALVVFAADSASMFASEKTLIVIDRHKEPGRCFRAVLPEAWGPENDLRLANMDFLELACATDADGVYGGFAD